MDELTRHGESVYRELTERAEGFLDYFYEATPVSEIGLLNIGSRPSHRATQDRSKYLRARHTLGIRLGAVASYPARLVRHRQRHRSLARQRPDTAGQTAEHVREWPFFRSLLSNTQMSLFKGDMDIAREYAQLPRKDPAAGERIYRMIRAEYQRTVTQVLNVTNAKRLIEENPQLALSLGRRNPYLDPLNHIQITLLQRFRDPELSEAEQHVWLDPLLRSINAIAAGMRNTG